MSDCGTEIFPVRIVYHNNRYASQLYDVDGDVLRGQTGEILNVFREELKDMLVSKKIRFMHYMTTEPTYAYFITSNEQLGRFLVERKEGSKNPMKCYHVYADY